MQLRLAKSQTQQHQIHQQTQRQVRRQKIIKAPNVTKTSRTTNVDRMRHEATKLLYSCLEKHNFPISNNIGIGVVSYERLDILQKLVDSITKHVDLRKTTVFISDDGSKNQQLIAYLNELVKTDNFVVLFNTHAGVIKNKDRLSRCLARFKYSFIVDSAEAFDDNWEIKLQKTWSYVAQQTDLDIQEITYVVPIRNADRDTSIITLINNIRAQRFPIINIIVVEQDIQTMININDYAPISYYFVESEKNNLLFNKAMAFNLGVYNTTTAKVILHDADMLVHSCYTKHVWDILEESESCHLGDNVIYTDSKSMEFINSCGLVDQNIKCEKIADYFEGGSIACRVATYWEVGAFNEDYYGWGCEDCDFYDRLKGYSKFANNRNFDFIHIWHPRITGWTKHHKINKRIETNLKKFSAYDRVQLQYKQLRKTEYSDKLGEVK